MRRSTLGKTRAPELVVLQQVLESNRTTSQSLGTAVPRRASVAMRARCNLSTERCDLINTSTASRCLVRHQSRTFEGILASQICWYLAFVGTKAASSPICMVQKDDKNSTISISRQFTIFKGCKHLNFTSPLLRIDVDTPTGGSGTPREDSACVASNEPGPAILHKIINHFEWGNFPSTLDHRLMQACMVSSGLCSVQRN